MKPLSFNMSKFKKIKGDEKSSTFKHDDGHLMTIAHSALSPSYAKSFRDLPAATQDAADAGEANATKMADGGEAMGVTYTKDYPDGSSHVEDHQPNGEVMQSDITTAGTNSIKGTPANQMGNEPMANGGQVKQSNPKLEESKKCPHCHSAMAMADAGLVGTDGTPIDLNANSSQVDGPATTPNASNTPQDAPQGSPAYNLGKDVSGGVRDALGAFKDVGSAIATPVVNTVSDLGNGLVGNTPAGIDPTDKPAAPAAVAKVAQANGHQPTAQAAANQAVNNPDPTGLGALQSGLQQGFAEQKTGVQQEAAAEGAQGKQTAAALDANAAQQQVTQKNYQDHFNELNQEYGNFMNDIKNQHIDPNHYWASKSTASKISTGLGLILGGIGSGLTGQGNAALEFLQNNINRDIKGQEANLGKEQNLLSANMRQFGNLKDATDMTRIMQQGIVANQLQSIAATNTDPVAKARAQQALGVIDQHQATEMQQFAQRRYMMQLMQQGPQQGATPGDNSQQISAMRMMGNEPMAKSLEERSVPGIGTAKVPVPEDARQKMIAMQNFHKQMGDLMDFASQHSGDLSPSDRMTGRAKAQAVQNAYRTGQDMGVYKASEAPLLEGEIPNNPTAFLNSIRVQPAYKAALDNNKMKLGTMTQAYGLPNPIAAKAATAASPQIKMSGGKKYMRGPNGEAVEVQ